MPRYHRHVHGLDLFDLIRIKIQLLATSLVLLTKEPAGTAEMEATYSRSSSEVDTHKFPKCLRLRIPKFIFLEIDPLKTPMAIPNKPPIEGHQF
jgi:hypothetical protein